MYGVRLLLLCFPAHRPLIQNNKIGKAELRDYKAHVLSLKS